MLHKILGLSVLLVLIGCGLPIHAQQAGSEILPSTVKFTGTLTGSDGKPLRGVVGINFYLYNDNESGPPLWMESQNVHLDRDGRYSVMLGSASAHGLPAEVFVGSGARWLGVEASGQTERPRTLLFSLPYGGPASSATQATQTVQKVDPGPQVAQKLPPTVHGNGVVNFIPLWTGTKVIGESVITQYGSTVAVAGSVSTTGNVGIGTTTPATSLDVFSSTAGLHAPIAQFGSNGTTDSNSILAYNGSGNTEMFASGCAGCFVPGSLVGDGGVRVARGNHILFGDSGASRLILDGSGNAEQPRTGGGLVKAMFKFSPFNGGRIVTCFNSTLFGAAATAPPCGFGFSIVQAGDYTFNLGSQIDDRILSLAGSAQGVVLNVCTDLDGCLGLNNQQVQVFSNGPGGFVDQKFYLVVY